MDGLMECAGRGTEAVDLHLPFAIKDHPWLGLRILFPCGLVGEGKIIHCLAGPYGDLLFDVRFAGEVPYLDAIRGPQLEDHPEHWQRSHRYTGKALLAIGVEVIGS